MQGNYTVLKLTEMSKFDQAKGVIKYRKYQIQTKGGAVITVDIDEKDFPSEKALLILDAAAIDTDKTMK